MNIPLNISKNGNGFYCYIDNEPYFVSLEALVALVTGKRAYAYLNKIK